MELSDAEVLSRSLGEPALFVHIFDRHGRAIHAYLARRVGSDLADDTLSEVWLQALRSRQTFEPRSPDARPWLYGIARNVLRAHWRAAARAARPGERAAHDPWSDVDDGLDAATRSPALRSALEALHPKDREVLLLVAWEDLSPGEVAVVLQVPAGTVRWRLHRARGALRRSLARAASDSTGLEPVMEV